jgi:hypothetical protein
MLINLLKGNNTYIDGLPLPPRLPGLPFPPSYKIIPNPSKLSSFFANPPIIILNKG